MSYIYIYIYIYIYMYIYIHIYKCSFVLEYFGNCLCNLYAYYMSHLNAVWCLNFEVNIFVICTLQESLQTEPEPARVLRNDKCAPD